MITMTTLKVSTTRTELLTVQLQMYRFLSVRRIGTLHECHLQKMKKFGALHVIFLAKILIQVF